MSHRSPRRLTQEPWHRGAAHTACPRRRGDRVRAIPTSVGTPMRAFWFFLVFAAMLCHTAHAAPPARSVTIGVIAPLSLPAIEGLRKGFRELGYVEGRNLRLEYRWAEGPAERYVNVAQELLQLGVDAIVTWGTPATMGARQATATLPIVTAAVGDPVAAQLVPNLARPGGNVTGFSSLATDRGKTPPSAQGAGPRPA